jgi:predicted TIM-barrel fold metal-dependent hydrolase
MTAPIIDTHVHFWALHDPALTYAWLTPEATHPILTVEELDQLRAADYTAEDYAKDVEGTGVRACVHVQAAIGSADPVEETAWLQRQADRVRFPHAIVGLADLAAADPREMLDRHLEHANFRGVRDYRFGDGGHLTDPAWQRGFRLLGELGLVASIDCTVETMPDVEALLAAAPDTPTVIDHMGFPVERSQEYFEQWQRGMRGLAAFDQTICKISEIGMIEHGWTVDSAAPWIRACIEAFGPQRCMFGSNWPVEKLYSSYAELVDAFRQVFAGYSADEQHAMFAGVAADLYSISLDEPR